MRFKGIELPVNSVIVIALAIFVLLMLAVFLTKGTGDMDRTQLGNAFNAGCSQLAMSYDCQSSGVGSITTNYQIGGKALSFLDACRQYINNGLASADDCVRNCPQCGTQQVSSGSPCPTDPQTHNQIAEGADCRSPYGSLVCKSGICCASTDTVSGGHCVSASVPTNTYIDCATTDCNPACVTPKRCSKLTASGTCGCN